MKWLRSLSSDDKKLILEVSFVIGSFIFSVVQLHSICKKDRRRSEFIGRLESVLDNLEGMSEDELLDEANRKT